MTQEEFHKRYQYNPATDCLGEGGFGKVYKAYDTHRDRWVAIKMAEVKPHLEEVRLKKEVEMISKLPSHPNIAYYEECYTFSSFTGEYDFGILQYYDQGNLEQLLSAKQLTESQKESILRQILEGITFLHSQGIIHRDLKPQNILIVNRNGEYIPKITDFGISKKLDASKSSVFTNSLAGAGTLVYASPEQLCGQTIKKNTDLWSFGVMACRVLLGRLPFEIGNNTITSEAGRMELYKKITQGELASYIQQLPPIWHDLVKRCLVVDNEVRIGSAAECLEMIDNNTSSDIRNHSNVASETKYIVRDDHTKEPPSLTDESSLVEKNNGNRRALLLIGVVIGVGLCLYFASVVLFPNYYKAIAKDTTAVDTAVAVDSVGEVSTGTTTSNINYFVGGDYNAKITLPSSIRNLDKNATRFATNDAGLKITISLGKCENRSMMDEYCQNIIRGTTRSLDNYNYPDEYGKSCWYDAKDQETKNWFYVRGVWDEQNQIFYTLEVEYNDNNCTLFKHIKENVDSFISYN